MKIETISFFKDIFLIRFSLDKAACFICLYNLSRLLVCLLIHHVYLKLLKEVINLSKLKDLKLINKWTLLNNSLCCLQKHKTGLMLFSRRWSPDCFEITQYLPTLHSCQSLHWLISTPTVLSKVSFWPERLVRNQK